jgi:opacity protein-like surface antigen
MRHRSILIAAVLTVLAAGPAAVSAQENGAPPMPAVEVSGGYMFMRDLSDDLPEKTNFPAGWYAAVGVNLNRWFGVVGEATGSYKSDFSLTMDEVTFSNSARVHTFMGGPRFSAKSGRLVPYAQMLVGGAHVRIKSTIPDLALAAPVSLTFTDTLFAVQPGGGLSVLVTENVGIRVGADYRTIIDFVDGGENEYTNEFRVLAGFTFNWGAR